MKYFAYFLQTQPELNGPLERGKDVVLALENSEGEKRGFLFKAQFNKALHYNRVYL